MSLPLNYERLSKYYEIVEPDFTESLMPFIDRIFQKYEVKKVLDLTCGTGRQLLWLADHGYQVVGSDISPEMLKMAKSNSRKAGYKFKLRQGDMRTVKFGSFDSVITMFNAIGHLDPSDFESAVRNVGLNLKTRGLYIFDILNFDFIKENFRTYRFMDLAKETGRMKFVRFNHNSLDTEMKVMHINQETIIQKAGSRPQIFKDRWTMQIYTAKELHDLLGKNGFEVSGQYSIDGHKFSKSKSSSILTVARKQN